MKFVKNIPHTLGGKYTSLANSPFVKGFDSFCTEDGLVRVLAHEVFKRLVNRYLKGLNEACTATKNERGSDVV